MNPIDAVAVTDLLRPHHDRTAGIDATGRLLRTVQAPGASPDAVLGSALVELLRRLFRDELQARAAATEAAPRSPWVTPPERPGSRASP